MYLLSVAAFGCCFTSQAEPDNDHPIPSPTSQLTLARYEDATLRYGEIDGSHSHGSSSATAAAVCITRHCSLVNCSSRPCASRAEQSVPPMDPALLFDGRPLKQTEQNTVSGGATGAGRTGDDAGDGVGSSSQPHVPTAKDCAIAHCSTVYPDIAPKTCA